MTKVEIKSIEQKDKANQINIMFGKIAPKYDLLNNLMTFGQHYSWKKSVIKLALKEVNPKKIIDLCSGTGDIAIIIKDFCPSSEITCIDNCKEMLDIAQDRFKRKNLKDINCTLSDLNELNLKEDNIDLITIGFGLRNLQNREYCLQSIYNHLENGGVFACIDLGHPSNTFWKQIFFLYFYGIIPKLGEIFAKNKDAYTYLPESLSAWYTQEELKGLLIKTGFKKCYFKNILGGAIAIHIAVK